MRLNRGWRVRAAVSALQLLLGASAAGQEPAPSPSPDLQPERMLPPPSDIDRTPRRVAVPGRPPARRDSAGAGRLKGWRALSLGEGEGRLLVEGVARKVKTGDSIAGYVVKAVGPGRVVLADAAAVAIITFDAGGAAHVRLVLTHDPTRDKPMGVPPQ
jgi:hypothetical protein